MRIHRWLLLTILFFAQPTLAATTFYPATPYVQFGNAPAGIFNGTVVLENFEDNAIDSFLTINPTAPDGMILEPFFPASDPAKNFTDSVDGDGNALIDGNGNSGRSYFSTGRSIDIQFAAPVVAAGFVWTDGDPLSSKVTLTAYGVGNSVLGTWDYGSLSDSVISGETAEDRFLGVRDLSGITRLVVANDPPGAGIEIDHIQWQQAVPEPSSLPLIGVASFVAGCFRKRLVRV